MHRMDRDQPASVRSHVQSYAYARPDAAAPCNHRGAAIVEAIIALPILLVVILAAIQFGLIYQAKATLNHASLQAARAGAVSNAAPDSIRQGLASGLLPLFSPERSVAGAVTTIARIDAQLATDARVRILNPTREAFDDFAEDVDDQRELPNDRLHVRSTAEGDASGLNIQDANVLKVEVTYGFPLRVPIVNWFISRVLLHANHDPDAFKRQLLTRTRLPILASATVRMQGPARLSDLVVARSDLPEVERFAVDTRPAESRGDDSDSDNSEAVDSDQRDREVGSNVGDPLLGFGSAGRPPPTTASTNTSERETSETSTEVADSSSTTTRNEAAAPLCSPTQGAAARDPDQDSGVLRQIWGELKSLAGTAVEFIKGFWEGIKEQLDDLVELITDPIEVAKGLYQLARNFIDDPAGTARAIGEALGKDLQQLVSCGAFDRGRVLGSNVDPAFMLKLATKLAKFGRLAHALDETKRAFGCASFVAGTSIWTAIGLQPIDTVQVGDWVTSRDRVTLEDGPHEVARTFHRTAPGYYALVIEDEVLRVTAEHPAWVQGKGWTAVEELRPGDPLATVHGDVLVRAAIPIEGPKEVFNFAVPGTESYFVGASGLWVHNTTCTIPPIYRAPRSPSGYAIGASDGGSGSWREVKRSATSPSAEAAYRYQQQVTGAPRDGPNIREYRVGDVDFDGYDAERDVLIDAKHYTEFCPLADCKPEFLRGKLATDLANQAERQIEALKRTETDASIEWHVANRQMATKIEEIIQHKLSRENWMLIKIVFTPDLAN
jgi:hypothetical protein